MIKKEDADKIRQLLGEFYVKKSFDVLSSMDKDTEKTLSEQEFEQLEKAVHYTDNTYEMKEISTTARNFATKLNDTNLASFTKVALMYQVGFYTGVFLLVSAVGIFVYNSLGGANGVDVGTNITSAILGGLGVADIILLLYTPVRELQKSRGIISKLSALYNEWQYISLWSGKTCKILNDKLKTKEELDPNTEKLLNEMRRMLDLKMETTSKLAKLMVEINTDVDNRTLRVSINTKPQNPEVNATVDLEAEVYGVSTSEAEIITYLWSEESGKITINNKDKRKASFSHGQSGEYVINVGVKVADRQGSAISRIQIGPKITAKAEPEKTKNGNTVKLSAQVEGMDKTAVNALSYKWTEVGGTTNQIKNDDKAFASVTPVSSGKFKFKVTVTQDTKILAEKDVTIDIT